MKKTFLGVAILIWSNLCLAEANSTAGYITVPGGKLYYQTIGKGDPIIIIHGGPGLEHGYLLPRLNQLQKNHQIIYYDQRSSGKSLPFTINKLSINVDQFVNDIDSIRQSLGYKRMTVLGHSWGGMLAMLYAIKFPQNTQALILMNSAPATSAGFKAFLTEVQRRIKPIQGQINSIIHLPDFIKGAPEAFNRYCQLLFAKYLYKASDIKQIPFDVSSVTAKNQTEIARIFNQSWFEKGYDIRPQLKHLNIPTLIIHGDYDPIPLWTAKQISSAIPKSQLVVIKQSGHFSYIEKPAEVLSTIDYFINHNQ